MEYTLKAKYIAKLPTEAIQNRNIISLDFGTYESSEIPFPPGEGLVCVWITHATASSSLF